MSRREKLDAWIAKADAVLAEYDSRFPAKQEVGEIATANNLQLEPVIEEAVVTDQAVLNQGQDNLDLAIAS